LFYVKSESFNLFNSILKHEVGFGQGLLCFSLSKTLKASLFPFALLDDFGNLIIKTVD